MIALSALSELFEVNDVFELLDRLSQSFNRDAKASLLEVL